MLAVTIATPVLWALVIGTLIPALTDLLAKEAAPAWLKAVLNAGLAAISGALTGALNANTLNGSHWEQILLTIGLAWLASVASYFGLWKPTGLSDKLSRATPNVGIG